jgi:hypothetical protein
VIVFVPRVLLLPPLPPHPASKSAAPQANTEEILFVEFIGLPPR